MLSNLCRQTHCCLAPGRQRSQVQHLSEIPVEMRLALLISSEVASKHEHALLGTREARGAEDVRGTTLGFTPGGERLFTPDGVQGVAPIATVCGCVRGKLEHRHVQLVLLG